MLLRYGGPTDAALPLVWAHAEYLKLVRSLADKRVFDLVECVRDRYLRTDRGEMVRWEVWSDKRPISRISVGARLRVIDRAPFMLEYTATDWPQSLQRTAIGTGIGVWYVDVMTDRIERLRFRFPYRDGGREDKQEYVIEIAR
jgi:glucoamylase